MTSTARSFPSVDASPSGSKLFGWERERLIAVIGLGMLKGVGAKTLHRLCLAIESPELLWSFGKDDFSSMPRNVISPEFGVKVYQAIQRVKSSDAIEECLRYMEAHQTHLLTSPRYEWSSQSYPLLLSHISDPPWMLFVAGNKEVLSGKTLGVVGTRRVSDYGRQVTSHLIKELSPVGPTIVSGLAEGVDGCAHREALRLNLPTVAVFGCGIDKIFPAMHRSLAQNILDSGGAWVSEYLPGMSGSSWSFPKRNRIIVGLSYGVVVVEGPKKSGSMITARLAMDENRSVFAPPGNLFNPSSEGPHYLIKEGAVPVTCGTDVLEELKWDGSKKEEHETALNLSLFSSEHASGGSGNQESLSRREKRLTETSVQEEDSLLEWIGYDPTSFELIRQRSGLSVTELQTRLTLLELTGRVMQLPGQHFRRV